MTASICAFAAVLSSHSYADTLSSTHADGSVWIGDFALPPSDLWSPELKAVFLKQIEQLNEGTLFPSPPQREASKDEWEKFHTANEQALADLLARTQELYAADMADTKIAGVHVGIITPKGGVPGKNKKRVLINLRGGGFLFNRGLTFGQIESLPVATIGGYRIVTVDSRQAPHHHYPAASEDVSAVYRALLKDYEPGAIGIFGCSSGGALAMEMIAWFQAKQLPRPGAVGALCMGPMVASGAFGDSSKLWNISVLPNKKSAESEGGRSNVDQLIQGPLRRNNLVSADRG